MIRSKRFALFLLMIIVISSVSTVSINHDNKQSQPIPSYRVDLQSSSKSSSLSTSSLSSNNNYDDEDDEDIMLDGPIDPLKILCQVNGYRINAAIDTGSRVSTMSASCAQRCRIYSKINVNKYINAKRAGDASQMIGTILNVPIELGPANFRTKLFIERSTGNNDDHDFIIGRDLLRRFDCLVSLKKNALYMNYRNQNFKIPILSDALEISTGDYDNKDDEDDDIMFASHSWKHNNNDNNNDNSNGEIYDPQMDELSDGDVMSMEGY